MRGRTIDSERVERAVQSLKSAAARSQRPSSDRLRARIDLQFLAPVFGGGDRPGVREPDRTYRVPSIRGQLRFWWRAARATAFGKRGDVARAYWWGPSGPAGAWAPVRAPAASGRER